MITGEKLKNARQKAGKTQEQLAYEVKISPRQLSRFENGENLWRYNKFLRLVVRLGLYKPTKDENSKED